MDPPSISFNPKSSASRSEPPNHLHPPTPSTPLRARSLFPSLVEWESSSFLDLQFTDIVAGLRTPPCNRPRQIRQRRHPRPRHRRRPHLPSLRNPSSHRQSHRSILPEIRGRTEQE